MDIAMNDVPLTLFTTLAPIGAGAFIALFIAFLKDAFDDAQLKKIDKLTIIPVLFALLGLICSFAHLANPGHAPNVMNTMGSTPLATEILWFCIFFAVAVIYWIVAIAGGLKSRGLRKGFSCVVAVLGLVSVIFMGMAYLIPAIPTWNSPWSIVSVLGVSLFGGVTLGMFICALAGSKNDDVNGDEIASKAVMLIGAVVLLIGTIMMYVTGSGAESPLIDVAANAESLIAVFALGLILVIVGAICAFLANDGRRVAMLGIAIVCAVVGCYLCRMVFYGMQIGLGL